ncbi:MAG: hypothetical protein WC444_01660 [Candidatus Paceibacterota bacterium]
MYQFIVLALGLVLIVGGGYFITKANDHGVLGVSIAGKPEPFAKLPTAEEVSGVYRCNETSGCKNPYMMTLTEDGVAQVDIERKDAIDVLKEYGTWVFKSGGLLALTINGSSAGSYDPPHAFLIQSIGTSTLSRYIFNAKQYTDLVKPVFTKSVQ